MESLPIIGKWIRDYEESFPYADPRTRHWLMVENSPIKMWTVTLSYLAFVLIAPRFMKNRKPFEIPVWFMFTYNMGLVALSLYMFIEIYINFFILDYDFICTKYTQDTRNNPLELRMAKVLWWYYFSKVIELLDTVLMILRKKNDQVTFLHVFHHASMLNIWWWVMMFIPGGCAYFGSSTNSLVHVVMYAYYGLAAVPSLRKHLWWKRYITKLQLLQFITTFSHSTYNWIYQPCDFPVWAQKLLSIYSIVLFGLFANFYLNRYKGSKADSKADRSKGDEVTNGAVGKKSARKDK